MNNWVFLVVASFQIVYLFVFTKHLHMPFNENIFMLFYCGCIPRSGNSGCVYMMLCKYFQTVFQSDRTILSSHWQYL